MAVYNASGATVMEITYDAWGNFTDTVSTMSYPPSIEQLQALAIPFRYRGYVYDQETGFYYLNGRYYDPSMHRFINADNAISGIGGNIKGYNLYAYCFNNPVMYVDPNGNWPEWIEKWKEKSFIYNVIIKNINADAGAGIGMGGEFKIGCFKIQAIERMDILGVEFKEGEFVWGHHGKSAASISLGYLSIGVESKTYETFGGAKREVYETSPNISIGSGFEIGFVGAVHASVSFSLSGAVESFVDYGEYWEWW